MFVALLPKSAADDNSHPPTTTVAGTASSDNNPSSNTTLTTSSLISSTTFDIVQDLPDPSTGEKRPYLLPSSNGSILCEMTRIGHKDIVDDDYCSFAVNGRYIIGGGGCNLHTITPVDPLFWLLQCHNDVQQQQQQQWQPLNQMLQASSCPDVIVRLLLQQQQQSTTTTTDLPQTQQIWHVLDVMELSEDEIFVKFSITKSLQWLLQKQQNVERVLIRQLRTQQQTKTKKLQKEGAFASGFTLSSSSKNTENSVNNQPSSNNEESSSSKKMDEEEEQNLLRTAKNESIQVVCNYLSISWQEKLLDHLQLPQSVLEKPQTDKRPRTTSTANTVNTVEDWNASLVVGNNNDLSSTNEAEVAAAEKKKKQQQNSISAGAKRLLKVNKKGMQKMSSFFAVKKKK